MHDDVIRDNKRTKKNHDQQSCCNQATPRQKSITGKNMKSSDQTDKRREHTHPNKTYLTERIYESVSAQEY